MPLQQWTLTDAQWQAIEAFLPRSAGGRPRINDRVVVTSSTSAELDVYGINASTLETRYRRWSQDGTLRRICDAVQGQ
jgi:transposase